MPSLYKIAQDVINIELLGLKKLSEQFNEGTSNSLAVNFEKAASMCSKISGRIIVTGMGKSGHIGKKISATLASTGTPSSFVHPAEASHGDLGMITQSDIVLALSNSGGTPELADIISYTTRYNIKLIAITSGKNSELDKSASISLVLPHSVEACSITKAPTTSTTMALALGDALAVTLLNIKGFTSSDFFKYHPGGKLGANLKRVSAIMQKLTPNMLCQSDIKFMEAIEIIDKSGIGCVGVINTNGALVGLLTDGDIRRSIKLNSFNSMVGQIMTKGPISIEENKLAAEGLNLLYKNKITSLFVTDKKGIPSGLVHIHDFLESGII